MLDARAHLETTALARLLAPDELRDLQASALERSFSRGAPLAAVGALLPFWIGVIEGLVSLSVTHADGDQTMLDIVGDGGWLGEGTLMKARPCQFDAVALRKTRAVLIPAAQFHRLRGSSLGFNHFLQDLLNARLGTMISAALSTRLDSLESRVARAVGELAHRSPAGDSLLRVSQAEVAMLAGTSRQRANLALKRLSELGLVDVVRGGLKVHDLRRLMAASSAQLQ
ncbi:Crp/Fnr family transcriptional regulator [Roseateles asaccharophilus]|uniref:CRP-like cAMP-binding protein n=1 Tax=Roseateles asaccharophilus TaxID=582607 RepID=A0ABU2AJE3_9BURK|nr:Crp/Fnr family transcriptional regulator [Roseateles asaccharophilus]MDR7336093.1 CRP-like cAMP-binding protein [Roseateles asaccharophilus]